MDRNIDNNSLKHEQTAKNNKKHYETLKNDIRYAIVSLEFCINLYCSEVKTMNENINEKWISIEEAAEHLGMDWTSFPKDSVFYFDPPYYITSAAYNDGKRGGKGWSIKEELELLRK